MGLSTFAADDSRNEVVETLLQDGGVIMRDLVAGDVMDQVYAEIQATISEADQRSSTLLWPEGNKTVGALASVSTTFAEYLMIHPKLLEVADAVLQPVVRMASDEAAVQKGRGEQSAGKSISELVENESGCKQLLWRALDEAEQRTCHHYRLGAAVMHEVNSVMENQMLHRENAIYQPYTRHLSGERELLISVMWAGTDFTNENGATRVVPASHKWPEDRIASEVEVTQAVMSKGSALIFLSQTLHGAASGSNTIRRTGFFQSFVPDWLTSEENQYVAVPPEVAARLSDKARSVLGYSASRSLGWVRGRDSKNLLVEGTGAPV